MIRLRLPTPLLHKILLLGAVSFIILCILIGSLPEEEYIALVSTPLLIYLLLTLFRRIVFFFGALYDKIAKSRRMEISLSSVPLPFVSIIVPCYNEEKVVADALRSLLRIKYPAYEVIVVDDGSTDQTDLMANSVAEASPFVSVTVIRKENGGKATALNEGIKNAKGDLILCCDADSLIEPNSLMAAVPHFLDKSVAAVAGFVEIIKDDTLILKFQQLEYQLGLNFLRRGMAVVGAVPIVPGPCGLFRKRAVQEAGGFESRRDIYAEDAELSMRLIANGWRINSEEDFIAYTEAPDNWRSLYRQRYRWSRGVFQAFRMNLFEILNHRNLRGYVLASYLFSEIYWIPLVNVGLTVMFVTHVFVHHSATLFTYLFAGLIVIELLSAIFASYKLGKPFRWVMVMLVSNFSYAILLMFWKVVALFEEWLDSPMNWDKLERRGLK